MGVTRWLLFLLLALTAGAADARKPTAENMLVGRWYGEYYQDKTWRLEWIVDRRADKTFSMELRIYGDVYGDPCWMRRLYKSAGTWSSDGNTYSNRVLTSSFRESSFVENHKITKLTEKSMRYWDRMDQTEYTDTKVADDFAFPACPAKD